MATILAEAITTWESSLQDLQAFIEKYGKCTSSLVATLDTQVCQVDIDGSIFRAVESVLGRVNHQLASLVELEKKLTLIRIDLNRCRNTSRTLSPISRIPPELLSYIASLGQQEDEDAYQQFQKSLDKLIYPLPTQFSSSGAPHTPEGVSEEDPEYKLYRYSKPRHFPILFSHVCQSWRDAVLSAATFWRKINIPSVNGIEKATQYLSRSKECQLEAVVEAYPLSNQTFQESQEFMMVRDNASRIASLDMVAHLPGDVILTLDELARASPLPSIHNLRLSAMVFSPASGCLTPSSPDLQYEDLLSGVRRLDLSSLFFPWQSAAYTGLTHLRLYGIGLGQPPSSNEIFSILSASPLLESLALEEIPLSDPAGEYHKVISLDKLHTLRLSRNVAASTGYACLLSMLHTPNVVNLSISQLEDCGPAFENFVKRLSSWSPSAKDVQEPPVQVLQLKICDFDEDMLKRLFSYMPNIVDLNLSCLSGFSHSALSSLAECDEGSVVPRLLPKLESLRITWCDAIRSPQLLKDLIQSRLRANEKSENGVKIERLVLMHCGVNRSDIGEMRSWFSENIPYFVYSYDAFGVQVIEDEGVGAVDAEEGEGNEEQ
ncbi:hypothetical protein FRC02_006436 [Tulasnella sp. 418]|nr:hypothetical protein FRC02_006436 [Tulasnella sp. 418]